MVRRCIRGARSGFMSGLMGGLIGAGIGGMLFGHGFMGGGLGGVWLPGSAAADLPDRGGGAVSVPLVHGRPVAGDGGRPEHLCARRDARSGSDAGWSGRRRAARRRSPSARRTTSSSSSCCKGIQAAWSAHDLNALQAMATPEMVSYFAEQLSEQVSRGVRNSVTDVHAGIGRSVAGLDRARTGLRDGGDAVLDDRCDAGRDWAGGRWQPDRACHGDGDLDIRALSRRALDPVGDPAGAVGSSATTGKVLPTRLRVEGD